MAAITQSSSSSSRMLRCRMQRVKPVTELQEKKRAKERRKSSSAFPACSCC
jgi:hypothetical protein